MPGRFQLHIQGAVLRILGIFFLSLSYVTITLYGVAFQLTLNQKVKKYPSPATPHPSLLSQGVRFALSRFYSPLLTGSRLTSFPAASKMLHFTAFLSLSG